MQVTQQNTGWTPPPATLGLRQFDRPRLPTPQDSESAGENEAWTRRDSRTPRVIEGELVGSAKPAPLVYTAQHVRNSPAILQSGHDGNNTASGSRAASIYNSVASLYTQFAKLRIDERA